MKSTILTLASVLASVSIAQPHGHNHAKLHRRGSVTTDVVWVTNWDYVTETVDVTTTIWVSEGYVAPTSTTSSHSTSSSSSSSLTSSTSQVPAQFFEPVSVPTTSSTSVYVAPTPSSTYVAPTTEAVPAYVAPVVSSSSSASVYVSETTPVAVAAPPAATTSVVVASSGSSNGQCNSGSPCEGDITYYDAGLGACGWTNNGTIENVVALPHALMGAQSNGNPYCGMMITIQCSSTGKTTTAKIVDKCMGCDGFSIDLSNAAFLDLDDLSVGRTTASWWFT